MKSIPKLLRCVPVLIATLVLLAGCGGRDARKDAYLERGRTFLSEGNYSKARLELKNVLQIDPKSAVPHYLLGQIAEKQGDLRQAFGEYLAAAKLDQKYVEPRQRLAHLYLLVNQQAKAQEMVKEVLALKPGDPDARTVDAALEARQGHQEQALDMAKDIVAKYPKEYDAVGLLASLYMSKKDVGSAVSTLENGIKANPDNIALTLTLAQIYANQKELEKAETLLNHVVELRPGVLEYRATLARFLAQTNQLGKAEKTLREAVAADPNNPESYLLLTTFLAQRKSVDEAEKELIADIKAKPELYELQFGLARLYIQTKNAERAEGIYKTIISRKGDDPSNPIGLKARDDLAELYAQQGDLNDAKDVITKVLADNPGDNAALLLKGRIALQEGKPDVAIGAFRSVLKDQPDSVEVLTLLAVAHLRNGEPDLARDNLQRASELRPNDVGARLRLARFFAQAGDSNRALSELQQGLKLSPKDLGLLQEKAELLRRTGDQQGAMDVLRTIVKEYPGNPVGYFGMGELYGLQKKYNEALKEYEQALKVAPKNVTVLQAKAQVLASKGELEKAGQVIGEIKAEYPKSPIGYYRMGQLYFSQRQYGKASVEFEDALKRSGRDVAAPMRALVASYVANKQPDKAVARLKEYLERNPKNGVVQRLLAQVYASRKEFGDAEAVLKTAIAGNRGDAAAYSELSNVYILQGRLDDAAGTLQDGLSQDPADLNLLMALAQVQQKQGQYAAAIGTYDKILKVRPDDLTAINNVAALIADHRTDEQSLARAKALVVRLTKVKSPAIQDTVGWVYYRAGEFSKAVEILQGVVQAAPQVAVFQYHLGMALYKQGDERQSKVHLEKAVANGAAFPGAEDAKRILAGMH